MLASARPGIVQHEDGDLSRFSLELSQNVAYRARKEFVSGTPHGPLSMPEIEELHEKHARHPV